MSYLLGVPVTATIVSGCFTPSNIFYDCREDYNKLSAQDVHVYIACGGTAEIDGKSGFKRKGWQSDCNGLGTVVALVWEVPFPVATCCVRTFLKGNGGMEHSRGKT